MAKRKRESSAPTAPVEAQAGPSSSQSTPTTVRTDRKGKGKEAVSNAGGQDGDGPMIHYSSADGKHWWSGRLDSKHDFAKMLRKVAKQVDVPKERAGELKIAYLRAGGMEAQIWDDFDYNAFKARAMSNPTLHVTMKVYTPQSPKLVTLPTAFSTNQYSHVPSNAPIPVKGTGMKSTAISPGQTLTSTSSVATVSSSANTTPRPAKKAKRAPTSKMSVVQPTSPSSPFSEPTLGQPPSLAVAAVSAPAEAVVKPAHLAKTATPSESSVKQPEASSSSLSSPMSSSSKAEEKQKRKIEKRARQSASTVASPSLPNVPSIQPLAAASDGHAERQQMKADRKKRKREKKAKRKSSTAESFSPSSPSSSWASAASPPHTPSPDSRGLHQPAHHVALSFADRYKPARPSPLANHIVTPASPATTASNVEPQIRSKRRMRKRASMRASSATKGVVSDAAADVASRQSSAVVPQTVHTTDASPTGSTSQRLAVSPEQPPQRAAQPIDVGGASAGEPTTAPGTTPPPTKSPGPAKNDSYHPVQSTDSGADSITAPEPSHSPVKKIVALSADYDLLRKPKESERDSSSITGTTRRQAPHTDSDSNESTPTVTSQSDDEDLEMGESANPPSSAGEGETDQARAGKGRTGQSNVALPTADAPASVLDGPIDFHVLSTNGTSLEKEHVLTGKTKKGQISSPHSKATVARPTAVFKQSKVDTDNGETEQPNGDDTTNSAVAQAPTAALLDSSTAHLDTTRTDEETPSALLSTTNGATKSTTKTRNTKSRSKSKGPDPPCAICLQTPSHLQKDCPEVKAGADNLRYLLSARKKQQQSLSEDDDGSHFATSIELIDWWLNRMSRIANQVEGRVEQVQAKDFLPRSPLKVMGTKTGEAIDLNATASNKAAKGNRRKSSTPSRSDDGDIVMASPESTTITLADTKTPADPLANGDGASHTKAPDVGRNGSSPDAPPSSLPPIHLRAMQKARRPGSMSGLSVSDAFIETEPSDESSSDDDESVDQDQTGADAASDAETASTTSSAISSSSALSSSTDTTTASATSRVPLPANPSNALSFSLTRELSEREKKKARLSAAKMQPVAFDSRSESSLEDEDADMDEEPFEPASSVKPRPAYVRAGSDSSIGDFGDDMSRRSSIDSTIQPPYLSQAPPIIASSSQAAIVDDLESLSSENEKDAPHTTMAAESAVAKFTPPLPAADETSIRSGRSRSSSADIVNDADGASASRTPRSGARSFAKLNGVADSSPEVDDSPGAQAVRRGIAQEEMPDDGAASQTQTEIEVAPPVPTQPIRRRRSSSRTTVEVVIPTQARRSSRTSVTASPVKQVRQSLEPEVRARTLRSASREAADAADAVPLRSTRSTRSVSRSKASESPSASLKSTQSSSTPRAGRLPGRSLLPEIEEAEPTDSETTPKLSPRKRGRPGRASQPTQLESSLPIIEESSQPNSSLLQTQPQSEVMTQSSPVRKSRDVSASPLFMTQGSQIPATQYYDPQPETIPSGDDTYQPPTTSQASPQKARGRPKGSKTKSESQKLESTPTSTTSKKVVTSPKASKAKAVSLSQPLPVQPTLPWPPAQGAGASLPSVSRSPISEANASSSSSSDNGADDEEDDDVVSIPDIAPPKLRHLPSSQPSSTAPIYPSLSSLPKDLLRHTTSFFLGGLRSQPQTPQASKKPMGGGESESDSGSGSDSSDDETKDVPSAIKNRFASGGMSKKRKSASQPAGW